MDIKAKVSMEKVKKEVGKEKARVVDIDPLVKQ